MRAPRARLALRASHAPRVARGASQTGRVLELRAAARLTAPAEVCISYGPEAGVASARDRRAALLRTHFFRCACAACQGARTEEEGGGSRALRAKAQALDERARAACDAGDFAAAAAHTASALHLLRRVFPPGGPQLAHEHMKLAQLLFNAGDARAASALGEAAALMEVCYGAAHDDVAELRRLAAMCR